MKPRKYIYIYLLSLIRADNNKNFYYKIKLIETILSIKRAPHTKGLKNRFYTNFYSKFHFMLPLPKPRLSSRHELLRLQVK